MTTDTPTSAGQPEICQVCERELSGDICFECRSSLDRAERDIINGNTMTTEELMESIAKPHTTADQLHAYYQLSDRVAPGGFAWPEEIGYGYDDDNGKVNAHQCLVLIINGTLQHVSPDSSWWPLAVSLIERAAEDWLESKGWAMRGERKQILADKGVVVGPLHLPAALAAENGRGG